MKKEIDKKFNFKQNQNIYPLKIEQLTQVSKLDKYNNLSSQSIINTFNYMYYKIRLGIFIS